MKRIRKLTIVLFFFCIVSIFSLSFVNMNRFSDYILQNMMGTNIKVKDIQLRGLTLTLTDLNISDLEGKEVGHLKSAKIKINPFLPSRIRSISANGGNLKIIQNKDGTLNVENIMHKSKNVSRVSNVTNITLDNLNVTYIDRSYNEEINKTLSNVSGKISNFLLDEYDINIKGESFGSITNQNEKFSVRLAKLRKNRRYLLSLFTLSKSKKDLETIREFKFKNVDVDSKLSQFIPLKDIKIEKGKINGYLNYNKVDNKTSLYSNLDVSSDCLYYLPYKGKISGVNANIKMRDKKINIKALGTLDNSEKLNLNLTYLMEDDKLSIKLVAPSLSLFNLNKYSLIEKLNLKGSGVVSLNVDMGLKLGEDKVKLETMNSNIASKKLNIYGIEFKNAFLIFKKDKNKKLNILANSDILKSKIEVNTKLNVDYDIDKNNINGEYKLKSLMKDIKIDDISGKIDLTPFTKGLLTVSSKQINGTVQLEDNILKADIKNSSNIGYIKDKINLNISSLLLNGQYNLKDKKYNVKINAKIDGNVYDKYVKMLLSSSLEDGKLNNNLILTNSAGNLHVDGITTLNDLKHNYKIIGDIEALTVMQIFKMDKNGATKGNTLPLHVNAKLMGEKKDISLEYDIYSKRANYYITAYDTRIKGYAKHILSDNRDIKAKLDMNEVWKNYHRLKELQADILYSDGNLVITNIKNEFTSGDVIYNLKDKKLYSRLKVENFVAYSVYEIPDVNVYVDKLSMNVSGKLDNLIAKISLEPSELRIKDKYIGYLEGEADLDSNKLNLNFKLNNNKIEGTYDITRGNFDIKANLDQKLQEIFNVAELSSNIKMDMHLTGTKNDVNMDIITNLSSLHYKKVSLPDINLKAHYEKGNISNLLKTGILYVDSFDLNNNLGNNIYHTNFKLDLANLNIDYNLKDKILDLRQLGQDFSGKLKINAKLKGNLDDFFGNLELNSDELIINGHKVNNLSIDGQMDHKGININQGYLEYERNPILIAGYMFFKPLDYMFRVVSENFNLEFLNIYPDISNAKGIANVNFIASRGDVEGSINVTDMSLKTKIVDISNFNINILMNNKDIDINKFEGNVNGGLVKLDGQATIPDIPDSIQELDEISLGKFNMDLLVDHVKVNYKDNTFVLSSELNLKGENLGGYVQLNSGSIEDLSFIDLMNKNKKNKAQKDGIIVKKIKVLVNNILKRYVVNVDFNMDKALTVDVPSYLLLKDIYGQINGGTNITFANGIPSMNGAFSVNDGKFTINGNEFTIETLDVTMTDSINGIDPYINLKATTEVNGEAIEIIINSKLSELNIEFRSQTNKSRDEILSLLAFKGYDIKGMTAKNVGINVINYATETALNQFISKFTNKIGKKIGLTKFDIGTNIGDKEKLGITNFIDNASVQLHLQGKLIKDKNLYWNAKAEIPFNTQKSNVKYDVNMSYKIADGLGANIGIKSDAEDMKYKSQNSIKNINFYTGVNYSNKFNNFGEFIDSLKYRFEKREKLEQDKKKSEKRKEVYEKQIKH